ncbi:MAG: hypothetical protein JXR77_06135, partial [Lentisphaeria bacterium]|nr:hypothetical protein [Lentisphaeria bacterium]
YWSTATVCAEFQDTGDWNGSTYVGKDDGYEDRIFLETGAAARDYLVAEGYGVTTVYDWQGTVTPLRHNNTNGSLWHTSGALYYFSPTFSTTGTTDIAAAVNAGSWLVLHRDHGYTGGSGWAHPHFVTANVNSLGNLNKLPVVLSINCQTGRFDDTDCFAEAWLKNSSGGSHSVIAATRDSYSWWNDWFVHGMFECFGGDYFSTLSGTSGYNTITYGGNAYGNSDTVSVIRAFGLRTVYDKWDTSPATKRTYELMAYFGDPCSPLRRVLPTALSASHPATLSVGQAATVTVTVTAGGSPVEGALVALVLDPWDYQTGTTNASGVASIPFTPQGAGAMLVTCSHPGHTPYEGTIAASLNAPVLQAEPPYTQGTSNTVTWSAVGGADQYYAEADNSGSGFPSPEQNSGWIPGTSHSFTGLGATSTNHYRAKAQLAMPGALDFWSQTTQADFLTDTLTNTTAAADGTVHLTDTGAPTTDTLGSTDFLYAPYAPEIHFGVYECTTSITLTRIESYLELSSSTAIEFSVFESATMNGVYALIHSNTVASPGTGTRFFSSGDISVPLTAGKYYAIGCGWNAAVPVQYIGAVGTTPTPISWGNCSLGAYYLSTYPAPGTFNGAGLAVNTYRNYHRLTTRNPSYAASGSVRTPGITPGSFARWGSLSFSSSTPTGTALTVDVLNNANTVLSAAVASGTDLDGLGITATTIKLRANLSTSNSSVTSSLASWQVTWQEPDTYAESAWSNIESSTQDPQTGSIGDVVWDDYDGNATEDPGELGIPGVTLRLYQDDGDNVFEPGAQDPLLDTQVTDGNGLYDFTGLFPGTYWVDVDDTSPPLIGFGRTTTYDPLRVVLASGQDQNGADFGYRQPMDFGDAPDDYRTLRTSDGARHVMAGLPFLGGAVDAEPDGLPGADALGDDNNAAPDEDGMTATPLIVGAPVTVTITVMGHGFLSAWMDWNHDGDWDDADEQIAADQELITGTYPFPLVVPAHALPSPGTYARLRYSTQTGLSSYGLAADGEVEDHRLPILAPPTVTLSVDEAAIAENGGGATFTATLSHATSLAVTVNLGFGGTAAAPADYTASATQIVIPAQGLTGTVTVTAADDGWNEADETVVVDITGVTNGTEDGTQQATTTITDDDEPGVAATPSGGLVTTEAGGQATFTLALTCRPTADVTIGLSSDNPGEGTVSPAGVTFTSENWSAAQTVTVTGVDDPVDDGDIAYSIVTAAAVSADADYSGLNAADVSVTNQDNDQPMDFGDAPD